MITKIDTSKYDEVDSIELDGLVLELVYNRNYFVNVDNPEDVILEICNDDEFEYHQIHVVDHHECLDYLGFVHSVFGIFHDNEIVELDSEIY